MGVPNVFGDVTRESRAAGADTSIPSWRLARGLRICAGQRGKSASVLSDNGSYHAGMVLRCFLSSLNL